MKKILKKLLEDGGKADKRLADLEKLADANKDRDFISPMPDWRAELKKQLIADVRYTTDESPPRKKLTRSEIDKFLATPEVRKEIEARKADWKHRDQSLQDAFEIMKTTAIAHKDFKTSEEKASGERLVAFAPGTDLGDLSSLGKDEQALDRFARRHRRPIHRALWNSFRREFEEELRHRMDSRGESREEVLLNIARFASLHAAERVLSRGWRTTWRRGPEAKKKASRMGRKPLEKTVDLGGGFTMILREPTPLELIDVLSGDVVTFGDRLLRASIVGSGGWRATSHEDVETFLREGHYSPEELTLLLREARTFVVDCILNARGAAFYEMGRVAFDDLSGGRTRREMVENRRMEPEITLPNGAQEAVLDDPEKAVIEREAETTLRDLLRNDRLTDRDRAIIKARAEGKNLKKIAADMGISHGYARNLWSSLRRKILPL